MNLTKSLKMKISTLRSYITIVVSAIVALCLVLTCAVFYLRTSSVLTHSTELLLRQRLGQINSQISDQISLIDSMNTLFLSNSLIRDSLDPMSSSSGLPYVEKKLSVEKQMGYLLYNTYIWNTKLIDSVYIFDSGGDVYQIASPDNPALSLSDSARLAASTPRNSMGLSICTLENNENLIYFVRNIYSIYSGSYIATIIINIDQQTWIDSLNANLDPSWFIYLYNSRFSVLTRKDMAPYAKALPELIRLPGHSEYLKELNIKGASFFVASQKIENADIVSAVAAPRHEIFKDLNDTMMTFILFACLVVAAALMAAVLLSRAVVRPVERMIEHVKKISRGQRDRMPPLEMYTEFNEYSNAFNHMLEQLDIYYRDIFQKQLLLKNAEIQALQSQMDPHFLFNVLNTIAWKAQMSGNEEIYQMVISLGEMLKRNAVSRENAFVTLSDELEYVRFYIYLQKMRFEDKISVEIKADPQLYPRYIPCFCIQPLVENAIVHGLEPKRGPGVLTVTISEREPFMEISIADDGVGFRPPEDIQHIASSAGSSHTHIALKNLDKRLYLLFGEESRLSVKSGPGLGTAVFFRIPLQYAPIQENTEE